MESDFSILIVDDEEFVAGFLKNLLMASGYAKVRVVHTKEAAFSQMEEDTPDAVLLDIDLESERDGIEIAEAINQRYHIPFIYITAQADKETVKRALHTKPTGYILKPFKQMDVYAAVHLMEKNTEESRVKYLYFKDRYAMVKIPFSTILYVQSSDNYIQIYTPEKRYTLRNSLDWFIKTAPTDTFQRVHRSYIVNRSKINRMSSKSVFINNVEIPVARGCRITLK